MIQECKFNIVADICPVVEGLDLDINAAIESGVVMDNGVDLEFNGYEHVDTIYGRVQDVFQAVDIQRQLVKAGRTPSVQPSVQSPDAAAKE